MKKPVKKIQPKKKPVKKKAKHPGGRPTVFTEENKEIIYKFLRSGANYTRACQMANISYHSYMEWMRKGREDRANGDNTKFSQFLDKIDEAKAYYITWLHNRVNKETEVDGKFALTILERKAKKEFGKDEVINVNSHVSGGTTNTNVNVNQNNINSDEETERLIGLLRTVKGLEPKSGNQESIDSETEQVHQDNSD